MYVWYVCVVHAFVSCAYVRVCGAYLRVHVRGAYTCVGVSMSRGEMQTDVPWNERKLSLGEPEMDALNDKILYIHLRGLIFRAGSGFICRKCCHL